MVLPNPPALPMLAAVPTTQLTTDQVLAPLIWVFFAAFGVSFVATPVMRWLARRNNIVDWPDLKRKAHAQPIPYLGGVAIFLGWLAGMVCAMFLHPGDVSAGVLMYTTPPPYILVGAGIIVFVGLMDDVYGVSPRVKVGGQVLAAAALANEKLGTGQTVGFLLVEQTAKVMGGYIPIPALIHPNALVCYILGTIIIAVFVVGGCNAVNLMDGLDGLAAGVTAIANLGFLFISVYVALLMAGNDPDLSGSDWIAAPTRIILCLALLGALLGFLPFNFNPASIFMGDTGSLLLGYLSVSTILLFAHTAAKGPMFVTAGLIVFALPIADTALAIVRRKIRGKPIFSADDQHLHHQFLRIFRSLNLSQNTSVKLAVVSLYLASLVFAALGAAVVFLRWRYVEAIALVVFSFILIAAYKAGQRQVIAIRSQTAEEVKNAAAPKPDEPPAPPAEAAPTDKQHSPAAPR